MVTPAKIRKFCAFQDRSMAEVKAKLKDYLLPNEDIEIIINQLIDEGFLNDERFAVGFAMSKLHAKGWGYAKIKYHLYQKGISNEIINKVLSDVDLTEWDHQIQRNIEKWKRTNELTQTTYPKLVRFLAGKGFKLTEIMRNIKQQ